MWYPLPMPDPAPTPVTSAGRPRLIAGIVLACTLGLLLFAEHLDSPAEAAVLQSTGPTKAGLEAYGFPGCGFKAVTGLPCATCGMTRSFTYMAEGDIAAAFNIQPLGAIVCIGVAMLALISAWALFAAMPMGPLFSSIFRPRNVIIATACLLAVWAFNIFRQVGYQHL